MTKNDAISARDLNALIKSLRKELIENYENIPLNLRDKKAWLGYRVTQINQQTGKFNKIPVYPCSGKNRSGEQGSEDDLKSLGIFDDAIEALKRDETLAGVGFATLGEFGVIALDVDHCVNDGVIEPNVLSLIGDAYAELSPSGTGIRAFMLGQATDGKNHTDGFELFSSKGFVTVTGNQLKGSMYYMLDNQEIDEIPSELCAKLEALSASKNKNQETNKNKSERLKEQANADPVMQAIIDKGLYERDLGFGKHSITCPWEDEHSDPDRAPGDGDTVYMQAHTNGYQKWHFHCSHAHCANRTRFDFEHAIGIGEFSDYAIPEIPIDGDIGSLFDDVTLTDEHVQKMADAEFLYPNMIVRGHVGAYVAPANGGKTAIFMHICEKLSARGLKVLYVNVDGSPGDLKRHHEHAKQHDYKVIAPDACDGKSVADVIKIFHAIANSNERFDDYVFIIDTLKKFVDVIDKRQAKGFYNLARSLSVKGVTVCFLGHCNKYKDDEGRPIYEGTADLRNDIDELIYLDSFKNEMTNKLEITTRPNKVRAEFSPISFVIDFNDERKVSQVDNVIKILPKEERDIVELFKDAINAGKHSQKMIIEYVKGKTDMGDKKIRDKLIFHSKCDNPSFTAALTGRGKDLHYSITANDDFEEGFI